MIDPSSSEYDESDEDVVDAPGNGDVRSVERNKSPNRSDTRSVSSSQGAVDTGTVVKGSSPSPSVTSEDPEVARAQMRKQEEDNMRLQLYAFVIRCIAFPFNAKKPVNMTKRQAKVNKQQLNTIKERFQNFLKGQSQIIADEALTNAVQDYYDIFLRSDRVTRMVASGGCSANDFREVFKSNIEKRVRQLPDINGLSKETVLSSWMVKFDAIYRGEEDTRRSNNRLASSATSEVILSKEQMYDMFQSILGVTKREHQAFYNAFQLDNGDEQAAAVRRELHSRMTAAGKIEENNLFPKFHCGNNEIERQLKDQYINELKQQVALLRGNLESLPVSRGSEKPSSTLRLPRLPASVLEQASEDDNVISKSDVDFRFSIQVIVIEVKGLKSLPARRIIYCTMEVEGCEKKQTEHAEASKPYWNTQGDFITTQPLPVVKIKLFAENTSVLSIDDKELGKVIIHPNPNFPKTPEWYTMVVPKSSQDSNMKIQLTVKMDRPPNMKYCGYLYAQGKGVWKKWRKRFTILVQVSQYVFAMCSYPERKSEPSEVLQLDRFIVDYAQPDPNFEGGKAFFTTMKEGEGVLFASDDEQDRILWVQAIYRATGQSHKPVPPTQVHKLADKHTKQSQMDAPISQFYADRVHDLGLDTYVGADPSKYDHSNLFQLLQTKTLSHRLNDSYSCLGWLSPSQVYVLEEYCARYGVRGCHRHLSFLSDLLDRAAEGAMIDPTLLHYNFSFAASHVYGNRPDGIGTVTLDEKHRFEDVKKRLEAHVRYQIIHFRYCFPFGRPDGALKAVLVLLERVLVSDPLKQASENMMRDYISQCLEKAALVNYSRVSEYGKVEENLKKEGVSPKQKLDVVIHLAELCIEVVQQNEEHHAEAFSWFSDLMTRHSDTFLELFGVDMDSVLEEQVPDTWDSVPLFQTLNEFLLPHPNLNKGVFHRHLQNAFSPLVIRYIDMMETSIAQSIHRVFRKEAWDSQSDFGMSAIFKQSQSYNLEMKKDGLSNATKLLWQLQMLQSFVHDLKWPPNKFGRHVQHRLKLMASSMIQGMIQRSLLRFQEEMKRTKVSADLEVSEKSCTLVNIIVECRKQTPKLCEPGLDTAKTRQVYQKAVDEVLESTFDAIEEILAEKLVKVMEYVLKKLSRYDEGSFSASVLSLSKPGTELADGHVNFMRVNQDILRSKFHDDEFVEKRLFTRWYDGSVKVMQDWLAERSELHVHQLKTLIRIFKKLVKDFELQGVLDVRKGAYETVYKRLTVEEATKSVTTTGGLGFGITMKDSDEEYEDGD